MGAYRAIPASGLRCWAVQLVAAALALGVCGLLSENRVEIRPFALVYFSARLDSAIVATDLTRDGLDDIVSCGQVLGTKRSTIAVGSVSNQYEAASDALFIPAFPDLVLCSVSAGDVNQDGMDDLLVAGSDPGAFTQTILYRTLEDGTLSSAPTSFFSTPLIPVYESCSMIGDLDSDGFVDFLLFGYDGSLVRTQLS